MKWILSAFHFLYVKNNGAHIKHNPNLSPKLRLQAALNAHFTVFFYSWLCLMSKEGDIPHMVVW